MTPEPPGPQGQNHHNPQPPEPFKTKSACPPFSYNNFHAKLTDFFLNYISPAHKCKGFLVEAGFSCHRPLGQFPEAQGHEIWTFFKTRELGEGLIQVLPIPKRPAVRGDKFFGGRG